MAGSPYVPNAKKYDPKDFPRVEGEPPDPDPSTSEIPQTSGLLPSLLTGKAFDEFVDNEFAALRATMHLSGML